MNTTKNGNTICSLKFATYIRMSSTMQEESPETQRFHMESFAEQQEAIICEEFFDSAVSASKKNFSDRRAGQQLLAAAQAKNRKWNAVLFYHLDRAFRDTIDQKLTLIMLRRLKVDVWTIRGQVNMDTADDIFRLDIEGALSEREVRRLGERVRDAGLKNANQGRFPAGFPPLGLHYNNQTKKMELTERSSDILKIFQSYIECGGSTSKTVIAVNSQGIKTATGKLWERAAIYRVIINPKYRRKLDYADVLVDAPELIPEIVPPEILAQADRILAQNSSMSGRSKPGNRVYNGLMKCASCGHTMRLQTSSANITGTKKWASWRCKNSQIQACPTRSVAGRYVDKLIGQVVSQLINYERDPIAAAEPGSRSKAEAAERKKVRLGDQKKRWHHLYAQGHIEYEELEKEIKAIEKELAQIEVVKLPQKLDRDQVDEMAEMLEEGWANLSVEIRREFLMLVGARITLGCVRGERLWLELETNLNDSIFKAEMSQVSRHKKR
jgi:DNA invertase Pin-like site-specific DNA recombinase